MTGICDFSVLRHKLRLVVSSELMNEPDTQSDLSHKVQTVLAATDYILNLRHNILCILKFFLVFQSSLHRKQKPAMKRTVSGKADEGPSDT